MDSTFFDNPILKSFCNGEIDINHPYTKNQLLVIYAFENYRKLSAKLDFGSFKSLAISTHKYLYDIFNTSNISLHGILKDCDHHMRCTFNIGNAIFCGINIIDYCEYEQNYYSYIDGVQIFCGEFYIIVPHDNHIMKPSHHQSMYYEQYNQIRLVNAYFNTHHMSIYRFKDRTISKKAFKVVTSNKRLFKKLYTDHEIKSTSNI